MWHFSFICFHSVFSTDFFPVFVLLVSFSFSFWYENCFISYIQGLLSLSMILFCCSICEEKNWVLCCINFCLHLLGVIIFATMATTTPTNRTSFYLIIYFDVSSIVLYHTISNNNSLSVCLYKIFTLTLAFVSRWHYFFPLVFIFYIARVFFLISFRYSWSFHVYWFNVVGQSFFFISLELVLAVLV